ncbi:MAG: porin [Comamonas thiooxydans]
MDRHFSPVLLASLSLAAAMGAQAQTGSSVTLYGHLDTGIEHLSNVQGGGSLTRMPGLTGTAPSRWGVRGKEDLGGGLNAEFALESGFGVDSGTLNQGGRGFGRQAWVGLSGDWGSASVGRNYTMLYWALFDADLLGPNAFGLSSLDSYIPNTRTDNSLAYRGRFGAWSLGGSYSFGRDTVNAGPSPSGANCAGESSADRQACRQWSAMLKYDTAPWGAALAVDEMRGGAGAFAGLVRSDMKDRRIMVNGYASLTPSLKLGAGVIRRDNDAAAAASLTNGATRRSNLAWVGLSWSPSTAVTVDGQIQQLRYSQGGDHSTLTALRGTYKLSKRTAAYAQVAHINNGKRLAISVSSAAVGGNPLAGDSQTGVMLGLKHSF